MTESRMSWKHDLLSLRNGLGFAAMFAVYGAVITVVNYGVEWLEIRGIKLLIIPFAADAVCGVLGYFVFAGDGPLRTWLVFFSVIAFAALMVLFNPGKAFYILLFAVPFAAVAAVTARAAGLYFEKRRNHHADA